LESTDQTKVVREACALHIANITPKGWLLGAKPLCVQGCEIWNGNCPIEKEAREQGTGEKVQMGIRPHLNQNHLTEVGDSDPCSAPPQESGVISPRKNSKNCLFIESAIALVHQIEQPQGGNG
jgi:hypothetical protein